MREAVLGLVVATLLAGGGSVPLTSATGSGSNQAGSSPLQAVSAFTFYWVSVGPTSCYLGSGVCSTTFVNTGTNSSYNLQVLGCQMDVITYSNPQAGDTQYGTLGGSVGGFRVASPSPGVFLQYLPAGGTAIATCTVPPSQLTLEPNGQPATGFYRMELVNSLGSFNPGKNASVSFAGTWMASSVTTAATLTSTSTFTSTATTTATYTTTTTATATSNSGPPSELPYQSVIVILAVALVLLSYLHVRRRPVG